MMSLTATFKINEKTGCIAIHLTLWPCRVKSFCVTLDDPDFWCRRYPPLFFAVITLGEDVL